MVDLDFYKELKGELIVLYFLNYLQAQNIVETVSEYPYLLTEINLSETFYKLLSVDKINNNTINRTLKYFQELDDAGKEFYMDDIIDLFDMLKENIDHEEALLCSITDYILISEEIIVDEEEINKKLDKYDNNDKKCLKMVKTNNKLIKKIMDDERGM